MHSFDVLYDLLQSCEDSEATIVRILAVEDVECDLTVHVFLQEITICHGEFIEIHHHGDISLIINRHFSYRPFQRQTSAAT